LSGASAAFDDDDAFTVPAGPFFGYPNPPVPGTNLPASG
jgi:hypothetical protein